MSKLIIALLLSLGFISTCSDFEEAERRTEVFDFSVSDHAFSAGFTDFAVAQESDIAFEAGIRSLPASAGNPKNALYHKGNNISDDLFMFFKKQITGLQPYTRYDVQFGIEFASNVGEDCIGDHVWIKSGVSNLEPARIVTDGYAQFNLDKGNQSNEGMFSVLLGTTKTSAPGCDSERWSSKSLEGEKAMALVSNADGSLWVWFGSESGFEVAHALYFQRFSVTFQEVRQ